MATRVIYTRAFVNFFSAGFVCILERDNMILRWIFTKYESIKLHFIFVIYLVKSPWLGPQLTELQHDSNHVITRILMASLTYPQK